MDALRNQPATSRAPTWDEQTQAMSRNSAKRDLHRRILRRRDDDCAICHEPIDYTLPYLHPREFVADHIIPFAKGGPETLDNKQASHRQCNRDKSDAIDYDPTTKQGVTIKRVRVW